MIRITGNHAVDTAIIVEATSDDNIQTKTVEENIPKIRSDETSNFSVVGFSVVVMTIIVLVILASIYKDEHD